jgi:hypothetical protein
VEAEGLIWWWNRVVALLLGFEGIVPTRFGLLMLNASIVSFPI